MGIYDKVLLTVDFDRTLTDPDSCVPQRNIDAIRYFMENGGAFTVNTGRSLNTFRDQMKVVPTNAPLLLFNGSAAYFEGQYTYQKEIDLNMWPVLNLMAEEFPELNLEVQGLDTHYLINAKKDYMEMYRGMGWPFKIAKEGDDLGPFIKFSLFGKPRYNKVGTMFDATEEEIELFRRAERRIWDLWGDKVTVYRAAPRIIDVHTRGVSEIKAARQLQKELGKEILVCVGDAENDIPMLDGADYAFCPADGVVADLYKNGCNCADGAVADVIYHEIPKILDIQA